jgi:hypothetical protein
MSLKKEQKTTPMGNNRQDNTENLSEKVYGKNDLDIIPEAVLTWFVVVYFISLVVYFLSIAAKNM